MPKTANVPTEHSHTCAACRADISCENVAADCPVICLNCVDDEALGVVERAQGAYLAAAHALQEAVSDARTVEVSWTRIGTELGVSKQAAQQRFGR